jgi:uncharacterized protein YbaP (TraB family)
MRCAMRCMWIVGWCALYATQSWSQTGPEGPAVDEVVVTGEQPGPQLWKATRNGHVLWILGTVTPKPRDITWKSKEVGLVLDDTQLVINQQLQGSTWPANISLEPDMSGPFQGLRAMRMASKIRKEYPQPPLRESVPPALYARFQLLKAKYMPKNRDVEMRRPRVAASALYAAAIAESGLTSRAMIHDEVHRLARKRRIKITEPTLVLKLDMDAFAAAQAEFNEIPLSAELKCFEDTLVQLESQIPLITARANAWATGNVEALRKLPPLTRESCDTVLWSAPRWKDLPSQLDKLWLDTIDTAVVKNPSTLVMLDMHELLQPNGVLEGLVKRGYEVDAP